MYARVLVAAIAALALAAPPARAQQPYTWTGSASTLWSNNLNWTPNGIPSAAGDSATFNGTSGTVSVNTAITVGQISFNNTSASTFTLALSGGSLTLNNGAADGALTTGPTTSGVTVSANLTVGGNGNLDLVMQNTAAGASGLTLSGAITASGGTVAVTQGLVILSGANTYSSGTRVDAGAVLQAGPGSGLSANSNLVFNGGQLLLPSGVSSVTNAVGTGAGQVRFAGSGGFAAPFGTLNVQLNGGTATQTWAAGNFLPDGASLLLGLATSSSGSVNFQNGLDLNGGIRTVSAAGASASMTHTLSGPITNSTGTGGLTKTGAAILQLTGTNTYNGPTTVAGGILAAAQGTGLPTASNLTLDGGTYAPTVLSGSILFTRSIGTGAGQVQWGPGGGGFSAGPNALTVRLNNNTGTLAWGSPGFVPAGAPLVFSNIGSPTFTGPSVDFQNGLDLGGATRTVQVNGDGTTNIMARISGPVVNTGGTPAGLTKAGTGFLDLTGTNTYDGPTAVNGGVLRAAVGTGLPAAGNLSLNGGVYEASGNGTFTRSIGTGPGQVQWAAGGGGLSAYNGTLTVQLNNSTGTLAWGSAGFVPSGQALAVGAYTDTTLGGPGAAGALDFQNGIDLNGATRTIDASFLPPNSNGTTVGGLVRFTGPISNSGGAAGVTINGSTFSPVVEFAGANTYNGPTTVSGATLRANPGQGLPAASNLVISGGMFELTGPATFSRTLGTAAGQVQLQSGGLGAFNGTVAIQLNGGTGTLTWGSSTFLQFSAGLTLTVRAAPGFAGQTVLDFQNGLNLNGTTRTVTALDYTTTPGNLARISGVISNSTGTAGLTVLSTGTTVTANSTLELTGANTYNGATTVSQATLRAVDGVGLPAGSNLILNNGVYESPGTATFTRLLGTTAGRVQWQSSAGGGFSAGSGTLTVQLNNGTGAVVWGTTAGFVGGSGKLIFGSRTGTGVVDFQNALDLGTSFSSRTIELRGGAAARLSGVVSNSAALSVSGFNGGGVMELTAPNTNSGGVTVSGATLMVLNTSGSGTGSGAVGVGASGVLGGTGTVAGAVTVNTGTIRAGNANGVGTLTLNGGLTLSNTTNNATLSVRVTDGSTPSATPGGSTVGGTPNPTSNNFLNVTVGNVTIVGGPKVVIDGTGTTFAPGQPYSYQVGQSAGQNLSGLSVTDQSLFTTVGFTASNFALTGDAGGGMYVSFTAAPVPEPGAVLGLASFVAGAGAVARRGRPRSSSEVV
jgi:autotransporter-associated beta strand protein